MNTWNTLPNQQTIDTTVQALKRNGIEAYVVENGQAAKTKLLELVPAGSEVMTMTSVTLDTLGITDELNDSSGAYKPVRDKMYAMNKATDAQEMNKLGAASEYTVGSVHAVTQDGSVLIASNTGSQLPAYAYSGLHIVWVVGAQKIVKNFEEAMKRIYEYSLPLESERARKAYGVEGSFVSKLLIINQENNPDRIKMIIVKENLGY